MQHELTHTIDLQSGICLHNGCDSRNRSETQLDRIESHLSFLRETVERLLTGMTEAQQSSGMAGMMARQMLPDMSAFTPVQKG